MRDFIVIVFVFALVVAGYYGYKQFFGEEEEVLPEATAEPQAAVENIPAPTPAPAPVEASPEPVQQAVDPATEAWKRLSAGKSLDKAADLYTLASYATSQGETAKALDYLERIYRECPESPYAHHAAVKVAERKLAEGDKWTARNVYSFAYDRAPDLETRRKCVAILDKLNADLIYSPAGSKDAVIYQIQPGDVLSKIAARFNCPFRLIMDINGIKDASKIRVGQRVKVLASPDGGPMEMTVLVDKSEFRLTVYFNGHYLKEYEVGIGQYDFTPSAEFTVGEKIEKPKYLNYEYGHAKNILGDYWLTLENDKFPGLGIHGTKEPETIGTKSSLGCIRMRNEDVGELFKMIPRSTRVTIRE
jgi:lipoprotein-anchoring transpeptidase ErfK/SrfK